MRRFSGIAGFGSLLVSIGLLAAACGGSDVARTAGEAAAGDDVDLAFSAQTVDGGQLDFGSLAGRDVVVWFWAPW